MKIYVGNFDFGLTEPELQALFTPFGAVESVAVVTDRDTGRSRGIVAADSAAGVRNGSLAGSFCS
jgi:hypothetical protein